jgi:hypothetical protein
MKPFEIQYDKAKNAANKLKHRGISLAETEPVFDDERALTLQDRDHDEQRWIIVGRTPRVVFWWWPTPGAIRMSFESFRRASRPKTSVANTRRHDHERRVRLQ